MSIPPWHREWLPTPRRVRVVFAGVTIADSRETMLLRQHGFLPVYYFPEVDVNRELLQPCSHTTWSPYKGEAGYADVVAGERRAPCAAWTYRQPLAGSPDTRGYWSFDFHAMDAWSEEGERIYVHARDPHLRVDALRSSRHVTVAVDGETVAETRRPVIALETGLVARHYLPRLDVDPNRLRASPTATRCPYKGEALYFDVRGGRGWREDAAWSYPAPLPDVVALADHLCFWAEQPGITVIVDGEPLSELGVRSDPGGGELMAPQRLFWPVPAPTLPPGSGRQHDHARPNRRAEGPPDELIDMDVERAGMRPEDRLAPVVDRPAPGIGLSRGAYFTAGPEREE